MANSPHTAKPILPALAVDAACSGNPGVMEFRGVIADTGTEVFHRGPFVQGTVGATETPQIEDGVECVEPGPVYDGSQGGNVAAR